MQARGPHFLLYSEASAASDGAAPRWKFVLQAAGGDESFSAGDTEPHTRPSRLELLAVVRGLEALDQPSRVTLVTRSRYVRRGIRRQLNHWRHCRWRWERFGRLVPIRDHDLWQRVDRALEFHRVECRAWREDGARACAKGPVAAKAPAAEAASPGAASPGAEPVLLVVRRRSSRWRRLRWSDVLAGAIGLLRQRLWSPLAHRWRPAFTRAA